MAVVTISPAAALQIAELPNAIHPRIDALIERLEKWPEVSGVKRLTGPLAGHYRLRTGDYRLQFRVERAAEKAEKSDEDEVIVEKVGHRDGFYGD